eukprot:CAMPEP_0178803660 /NCGR_PEP_ID=MMETSP0745-20121128/14608_1 /TAXON_ID=913974 /ORGANISM="Nitzschia punctata, Strain CCMP561" /LENGTH=332 /DNA_ID=CAMNT_0020462795 /DNA_START=27 /DNA_END=1025 /DNA_ORIENTATION=-
MIMNQQPLIRPTSMISLHAAAAALAVAHGGTVDPNQLVLCANNGGVPSSSPMKRSLSAFPLGTASNGFHNKDNNSNNATTEQPPLKKQRLVEAMAAQGATKKLMIRPSQYAKSVFKSNGYSVTDIQRRYTQEVVQTPTPAMIRAYGPRVLDVVRRGDLVGLEKAARDGVPIPCCNRFGESLLHLAARRGYVDIVKFLLKHQEEQQQEQRESTTGSDDEAAASSCSSSSSSVSNMLHIRDDYQRTPLHDACWTAEPNFELVHVLLEYAPEQVLMEDVRGNTPFDYVRKAHYEQWLRFLWQRKALLQPKTLTVTTNQEGRQANSPTTTCTTGDN